MVTIKVKMRRAERSQERPRDYEISASKEAGQQQQTCLISLEKINVDRNIQILYVEYLLAL